MQRKSTGDRFFSGNLLLILLAGGILLSASGCADSNATDMPQDNRIAIRMADSANVFPLEGLGCEWDPFFWTPYNQKHGVTQDDWDMILDRVDAMDLHFVRTLVLPTWIEPRNDNDDPYQTDLSQFDFENPLVESLVRQLSACQDMGLWVCISYHGIPAGSWLAYPNAEGWSAPNSIEEFAENIQALMRFLVVEKGFTCIRDLNLFNEPNLGFRKGPAEVDEAGYRDLLRTVHTRLSSDEQLAHLRLVVPDDSQDMDFFRRTIENVTDISGVLSSHNYQFTEISPNMDIYYWARGLMAIRDQAAPEKPHILYEFGNRNYVDAYHVMDAGDYERALFLPKFLCTYFNEGGSGASYWILFDQFYYDGPAEKAKMNMGLWGFKDEEWALRPTFRIYSAMCQSIRPGQAIHPLATSDPDLVGTAFQDTNGAQSFWIVNPSTEEKAILLVDTNRKGTQYKGVFLNRENTESNPVTPLDRDFLRSREGVALTMEPESFLVLRRNP